jgi:hypothetical protein
MSWVNVGVQRESIPVIFKPLELPEPAREPEREDQDHETEPLPSELRPTEQDPRCNSSGLGVMDNGWVLEPAPEHPAPDAGAICGLYSWRRPTKRW